MFNKISNDSKVPNSYIYTSHTGSEYIFLEGAWFNADTMVEIHSSKNYKMNESALRQIAQQNQHSTLQIGQKYTINENNYVYVGRGRMTLDGMLLTESRNSQVVTLMEAQDLQIPSGYIYTSGKGKKYFKKGSNWYSSDTKAKVNTSAAMSLERAAQEQIKKHNETSTVKIGQEWTSSKGKTYRYAGEGRWVSDDGKMLPPSMGQQLVQKLESEQGEPEDNAQPTPEPEQSAEPASEPKEEPKEKPTQEPRGESDKVTELAEIIKSHPNAKKIRVLLGRGDEVSLLAADILLAGKESDAIEILKSLNKEEN